MDLTVLSTIVKSWLCSMLAFDIQEGQEWVSDHTCDRPSSCTIVLSRSYSKTWDAN